MRIRYRLMDTDNGGIEWSDWQETEIPDTEDEKQAALAIADANWREVTE